MYIYIYIYICILYTYISFLNILWAFSHSKSLKFAYCLGGFLVKITLNLLKSALSIHTTLLHFSVFFFGVSEGNPSPIQRRKHLPSFGKTLPRST